MTDGRVAVYTAIFGDYDCLLDPLVIDPEAEYFCFTDDTSMSSDVWDIRLVEPDLPPALTNRRFKFFPHEYLPDYDYSVYVDGNVKILQTVNELVSAWMDETAILLYAHPSNTSLRAEAESCIRKGKAGEDAVRSQVARYEEEGFPTDTRLPSNTILIRDNTASGMQQAMNDWWEELQKETQRDQLSLLYALWKNDQDYTIIPAAEREARFDVYSHKPHGLKRFIWPVWLPIQERRYESHAISAVYHTVKSIEHVVTETIR